LVQVGNIHIGRAETAAKPAVDTGEVFLLWDLLVTRYDTIEFTQIMLNFIHDPDFRALMSRGLTKVLEKQVDRLEKEMNTLRIPLPDRPPKSIKVPSTTGVIEDQFIYKQTLTGIQSILDQHVRTIRSVTTSDTLRKMFIDFLKQEVDIFDNFIKYGKLKGWLQIPPKYTP